MKEIKAIHKVFATLTILKGIHAIIEILLGVALFILSKEFISKAIVVIINGRLAGDPNWFIAQYITQFGVDLSLGIKLFFAIYLLSHGLVNLSLVYGIMKRPSFAYPLSLLVFISFLVYQIYSYFALFSLWMLLIIIFDIVFILLLFYEYRRHLRKYSFFGRLKLLVKAKVPIIVKIKLPKILIIQKLRGR